MNFKPTYTNVAVCLGEDKPNQTPLVDRMATKVSHGVYPIVELFTVLLCDLIQKKLINVDSEADINPVF